MRGAKLNSPVLEVSHLSVTRGDRTLFSGLDFSLAAGELVYLRGPNGSGKTTLMRALCGLVRPDDGEIRWQGEVIASLGDEYYRDLLYLGHQPSLKDDLTALENLQVIATLAGVSVSEDDILAAIDRMALTGLEDLPVRVLSQGQKRRISLVRLLLLEAKIWLLDEPFTALDARSVECLCGLIDEHLAAAGLLLLTTHQAVAIKAASREIVLG